MLLEGYQGSHVENGVIQWTRVHLHGPKIGERLHRMIIAGALLVDFILLTALVHCIQDAASAGQSNDAHVPNCEERNTYPNRLVLATGPCIPSTASLAAKVSTNAVLCFYSSRAIAPNTVGGEPVMAQHETLLTALETLDEHNVRAERDNTYEKKYEEVAIVAER